MGPTTDLVWIMAPVVIGYLALYAHAALAVSSFLIWWFWSVALNGPHFYATISRTYLDKRERAEHPWLLVGSLGWLLLGPACLYATLVTGNRAPFMAFWLFQVLWAYFHVVRQHYGFMALYQRRNGEAAGGMNALDYWCFHVVMFGLVAALLLQYPDLRQALGLGPRYTGLEAAIIAWSLPLVLATAALWLVLQVRAWRATRRLNGPKLLLLASYVPFHVLLLLYPTWSGSWDFLFVQAAFTMPHNLQYMAIVWFYNRNRFGADPDGRQYGFASVANKSVLRFALFALAASIVLFYSRWYFEGVAVPFAPGRYAGADVPLGQGFRVADLVAAAWIGIVFHHQYLDQKIWKVSRDTRLQHDLRLAESS
jgi:hypothetical protein